MAWSLATRGLRVLVLDRARFPREKVCGDFVEPRGLRLFQTMGCLTHIESAGPLAITHVNLFLSGQSAYREHIPFYAGQADLPQHGYIIPREELDQRILASAVAAGAELREGCQVSHVERVGEKMVVHVEGRSGRVQRDRADRRRRRRHAFGRGALGRSAGRRPTLHGRVAARVRRGYRDAEW